MSTVAYRDGIMVGDTAAHRGELYIGTVSKVFTRTRGNIGLLGVVGNICDYQPVFHWWDVDGLKPEKVGDNFRALKVGIQGNVVYLDNSLNEYVIEAPFHALGSGAELALGAMAAGATAEQAVIIACQFDACSRLPIDVMALRRL